MHLFPWLKKPLVIIGVLVLIGLSLRVYKLGEVPGGFHEDEAHIGYNAYSLLKTAKDKNNVFLPLAIDQFGDFRPAGLHYLTVPSVAIFGLNEFATRLPVAVFGALSIIVIYFLTLEIFQKQSVALLTAGLLTFNPWSIIASRSTSESIVGLFFVMWGAIYIVRLLRNWKLRYLIYSTILFCISFLFYHAPRYFVPFLLAYFLFVVLRAKQIKKRAKVAFGVSIIVVLLFLGFLFKFAGGSGRTAEVSIFDNPATKILQWTQVHEDGGGNVFITRFFHNAVTNYSYTALSNYLEHFSPDFLFLKGGLPPRYKVPWSGNFYPIDGLFFLVGFAFVISEFLKKRDHHVWILLIPVIWLLLGPIPAAFTFEDIPHFQRSIMMMSGFLMLIGFGIVVLYNAFSSRRWRIVLFTVLGAVYVYSILLFNHNYFVHSLVHEPWYRNEGQKDLVMAADTYAKQGLHVVMTTQNANKLIFYLFYNKVDPAYYQKIGSPRDHDGLTFGNFIFTDSNCPSNNVESLTLYKFPVVFVDAGDCKVKPGFVKLQDIKRKDDTVVFHIVKYDPAASPITLSGSM